MYSISKLKAHSHRSDRTELNWAVSSQFTTTLYLKTTLTLHTVTANAHQSILVIFGRDVAERVFCRMVVSVCNPTSPNYALPGETWTPEIVFSVTVANWVPAETTHIVVRNEILHGGWSLGKAIERFLSCGGWNLPFLIYLAIGLYKIVILQQIKEVIAKGHQKLNKLMIAQSP